jgi:hypothetical protein
MPATRWRCQIHFNDLKDGYENETLSLTEFCGGIADRIMASAWPAQNDRIEGLAYELRYLETEEEVDEILEELYDLADIDRVWFDANFGGTSD